MKKYFINHFCILYFKKISTTPLDTQGLKYASDFSTAPSSFVLDDSENIQKEILTLESSLEAPSDTPGLKYSESEMSSCSTEDRSERFSNESIILDFSKLKSYDIEPTCKPGMFLLESELESETEEQGRIVKTQIGVNTVKASLWLPIRKACVVRTLTNS